MKDEDILERNGKLIALIKELDLGIHVIDFPHKPKLLSADYKYWLSGYVKNFHLLLNSDVVAETPLFDFKLRSLNEMNIEEIKSDFHTWIINSTHKRIYTISNENALFVAGFGHHNKLLKSNPYPVFALYDPHIYYDIEQAEAVIEKFSSYNLKIN